MRQGRSQGWAARSPAPRFPWAYSTAVESCDRCPTRRAKSYCCCCPCKPQALCRKENMGEKMRATCVVAAGRTSLGKGRASEKSPHIFLRADPACP